MLTIAEQPAILRRLLSTSVKAYHLMGEIHALSERTELLRGAVIEQMPKSPLHSSIVRLLDKHLLQIVPPGFHPRAEQPLTFADSEPEPDLAIVVGAESDYFAAHPQTAEIVVEVCVSSEDIDRLKLSIYAEAGVKECWLVLAERQQAERHSDLRDGVYTRVEVASAGRVLASTVLPDVSLPVAGMFPTRS